jgi:hypothetical protein
MTNKPDPEQERLMRLRDKQISARDPLVKTRKFNQQAAERERKRNKSVSLVEFWTAIPQVVRSGFFGLLLGLVLLKIVTGIWISPLAMPIMVVITIVSTAMGAVIGNAIELRDNIKRHL